jgi:hypothetical protein
MNRRQRGFHAVAWPVLALLILALAAASLAARGRMVAPDTGIAEAEAA